MAAELRVGVGGGKNENSPGGGKPPLYFSPVRVVYRLMVDDALVRPALFPLSEANED